MPSGEPGTPRHPTEEEYMGWFEAAAQRKPTVSFQAAIKKIEISNPYRLWRLKRDFKWLQRQFKKAGIDPEEARWFL